MSLAEGKEHHVRYGWRTNPAEKGLIPMAEEPNSFFFQHCCWKRLPVITETEYLDAIQPFDL